MSDYTKKQARPGDTVRITIPNAVVTHLDDHDRVVMAKFSDVDKGTYIPETATVEVLERADDPLQAPLGQVRREDHEGGHSIWALVENENGRKLWRCIVSTATGNRDAYISVRGAAGWPVIGAVPDTPAAEAEKPYSVTLVMPCGHDTTEHGPVCPDNVELPDWEREYPEVSGAGVPFPREPRTFRSDGPEPPAGVDHLEANRDKQGWTHVKRDGGKWWRWSNRHGDAFGTQEWRHLPSDIEFREVV